MTEAQGTTEKQLTVMLVDDHDLFREGLRDLLEERSFEVVGEAENATDAIALAAENRPDVVLMDINLQGRSGIEATHDLRVVSPTTRVVMLTVSPNEDDIIEAIGAGASGYLLKDSPVADIESGVRAAAAGESLLSPRIAAAVIDRLRTWTHQNSREESPELTPRELEVLQLITAGKENGEIASELVISEQTVKSHVSSVLSKLQVDNRIQAAVYAVRERLF